MKNTSQNIPEALDEKIRGLLAKISKLESENTELKKQVENLRKFRRADVPKDSLSKHIRDGKTNKQLAKLFNVSERTISRRVREYGLKGLRGHGPRPSYNITEKKSPEEWISVETHMGKLDQKYHFVNVQYPHTRYINPKTKVCSDSKANPSESYTTVGMYYIAQNSGVYLVYRTRIRYSEEPVPFDEIHQWIKRNGKDILYSSWIENQLSVVEMVGYTFINPQDKPERIVSEVA